MRVACHTADFTDPNDSKIYPNPVVVPDWSNGMVPPLFTDFTYDNLGVPKSKHWLLRSNPDDFGLGGQPMNIDGAKGLFKVMPLRGIRRHQALCPQRLFSNALGHRPFL